MKSFHRALSLRPLGLREICTTQVLHSGHSRWSKIKHDKKKEDVNLCHSPCCKRMLTDRLLGHEEYGAVADIAQYLSSCQKCVDRPVYLCLLRRSTDRLCGQRMEVIQTPIANYLRF